MHSPANGPKILLLTRRLEIGGAERQLVELAVGLHGIGWQVKVVTFYPGGALASRLAHAGVPLLDLGKSGRWDVLGFAARLVKLVRRERPHIVHGYLETSNVLLSLLRSCFAGARIVWGVRASNMDLTRYGRVAALQARLGAMLSHCADLIICNSASGRAYHASRGYPPGKMIVIPNGVDVSRFRPDAASRSAVRAEWGVAPDEILVGVVARLDAMKDHRNFVRAAAQVAALRPDVRFACIGDGPAAYREALFEEARALGLERRIIWAGARDDMPRVYNALDLTVSSSAFGEGFPNTIAEAMATGVPCVVTDVGDSAHIVGELGWVCAPADSSALCKAIVCAIEALPCDRQRIREHIASSYNAAMLVERTVAALTPLIPDRAGIAGDFRWRQG
jgi:glycosyltransferase involved in cell wall biosynthesis